jgi:hypothetical protein
VSINGGSVGTYLKHKDGQPAKKRASKQPPQPQQPNTVVLTGPEHPPHLSTPSIQHDINHVAGIAGIEESLDYIARQVGRLSNDENSVGLSLGQGEHTYPIKLTLAENDFDDTMDRLVTAFERIADSVAKLAGLNRPRLESWHDQDEYVPRYRDSACDGGVPGPKKDPA